MDDDEPVSPVADGGGLHVRGAGGSRLALRPVGIAAPQQIPADVLDAVGLREVAAATLDIESTPGGLRGADGRLAVPAPLTVSVPDADPGTGHVLLVEDAGALRWIVPDRPRGRRDGGTLTFTVDVDRRDVGSARGLLGSMTTRVLRALSFELVDADGGPVGRHFVERWEAARRPARLRSFTRDDFDRPVDGSLDAETIAGLAAGRALLVLHGVNARSNTGFTGLSRRLVEQLHERYGGRVVAYDHPTLAVDPVTNARHLLTMLPEGVELEVDVLAHSRGGLVARVLAERPDDLGVDASRLRVRQVVFVGTPNHGTPLADPDHLGSLVDAMTNVLGAVPDNRARPSIDTFAGLVAVVKQLAVGELGGLDGLTAMRPPESDAASLLARLNQPRPVDARYRAIASDYEPAPDSGLARRARDGLVDRLFGYDENDLLVPTLSVYRWNGASGFPIGERLVLSPARAIDHSSYWSAPEVTAQLDSWLVADELVVAGPAPATGMRMANARRDGEEPEPFADVDDRLAAGDLDGVRAAVRALPEQQRQQLEQEVGKLTVDRFSRGAPAAKRGRVIVLPGIMGSLLTVREPGGRDDRIWISLLRLLNGDFARLRNPSPAPISADGLHRSYLPLVISLDAEWDVVPFAYDWRLGLDVAAAALADRIVELGGPAHLVAHSMGGLVCRVLRARHRGVWDSLRAGDDLSAGGRLVMLGTPSLGSLSIATALTADDRMVRWLSVLDITHRADDLQQILATFPGVYQLLPNDDAAGPLYDAASWRTGQVSGPLLAEASRLGQELVADGFDASRTLYVAGSGHRTADSVVVDGPGRFRYVVTTAGDGRVTHRSGLGAGAMGAPALGAAWYSTADHGGLVKDAVVARAVSQLLASGTTQLLPTAPPARRSAETAELVTGDRLEPLPSLDFDPFPTTARGSAATIQHRARVARDIAAEAVRGWLGSPPATATPLPALGVHVLHASIEHATHEVVVGHYAGTPIGGAEGWADQLLHGRLSARQVLGRYPSQPGDVLRPINVEPGEAGRVPGVVVIGLGEMGELTPMRLTSAMRSAALETALAAARPAADDETALPVTIGLASVLVGSYGPDALPLPAVVSALVEGVLLANRELTETITGRTVRIDELELVELYAQRAEEAARIVRELDRYLPEAVRAGSAVQCAERLRVGEGGRRAAPGGDYAMGMWRRLIVSVPDDAAPDGDLPDARVPFVFTSLGVRARADRLPHVVDNRLLGRLVRGAVGSAEVDGAVNVALLELLLPNELKRELATIENLVLVVDDHTATIPWEALADRTSVSGVEPLVKRMGLVRQLQLQERHERAGPAIRPRAFVIGDPPVGGAFSRLDGARHEATEVVTQLTGAGLPVDAMIFEPDATYDAGTAGAMVGRLLADDYQILHIAAHGWFEPRDPTRPDAPAWGGVVIGPDQYLTAVEIGQMRRPPDLVFLNCCHLASVDGRPGQPGPTEQDMAFQVLHRPQLAASLSRTLMAMGVRAVVAAGWAVDDRAAAEFAKVFYDRLLDGESFGPAVRAARGAAHDSDRGSSNTWAAYQCYGDPGFRIATARRRARRVSDPVSADEVVRIVDILAVRAGDSGVELGTVRDQLQALEAIAQANWPDRGAVLSSFGRAYGECGDLDTAVARYRAALQAPDGDVPIRALEQLLNLEVRLAAALVDDGRETATIAGVATTAHDLLDRARTRADVLAALPATPERLAITAGMWKARATHERGAERRASLRHAARNYFETWVLDGKPYGATNALQLDGTGGLLTARQRSRLRDAIEDPEFFVRAGGDFWGRVALADRHLTIALADGSILAEPTHAHLCAAYRDVFSSRSTARERSSPVRHIRELSALAREAAVAAALRAVADDLDRWTPS